MKIPQKTIEAAARKLIAANAAKQEAYDARSEELWSAHDVLTELDPDCIAPDDVVNFADGRRYFKSKAARKVFTESECATAIVAIDVAQERAKEARIALGHILKLYNKVDRALTNR